MQYEFKYDDKEVSDAGGHKHDERAEELHVITVCDSDESQPPLMSPLLRGMNLDLSLAAEAKARSNSVAIQEELVSVIFDLPDGSQGENMFKLGQTVEVLKSFVESEYGIPMTTQRLFLSASEKQMLNPLSLLDYAEIKGHEEVFVRVEGELPRGARK